MSGDVNKRFLESISQESRELILDHVAKEYGITQQEANDELTGEGAEELLEYLRGDVRAVVSVLCKNRVVVRGRRKRWK